LPNGSCAKTRVSFESGGNRLSKPMTDVQEVAELLRQGYNFPGDVSGPVASYVPTCHLVLTTPSFSRRLLNRAIIEEAIHATTVSLRPPQQYPLLNALTSSSAFPGLEVFRDIVEALFVTTHRLARYKAVDARFLPRSPFKELGKRIIRTAVRLAKTASPSLSPVQARKSALWALSVFLMNAVPRRANAGSSILDCVERFQQPENWETPHDLFEHLVASTIEVEKREPGAFPFSISRPPEPHRNIVEMLRVLTLVRDASSDTLLPLLPALLGFLTIGIVSFLPILWIRPRGARVMVAVEVWDQTLGSLGDRSLSEVLESMPQQKCPQDCRAGALQKEYVHLLSCTNIPYEDPLGRLQMFQVSLGCLPDLIRKHLARFSRKRCSCSYCNIAFGDPEFAELTRQVLDKTSWPGNRVKHLAGVYPQWLTRECILGIQEMRKDPRPFVLVGICRPNFGTPNGRRARGRPSG